jgi:hypothetical protein
MSSWRDNVRMDRRAVLLGVGTMLAGCADNNSSGDASGNDPPDPTSSPTQTATPEPTPTETARGIDGLVSDSRYLEPISVEAYVDRYSEGVRGVIKNVSERTLDYVKVDMYFYQGDTRVGDSLDNTSNLTAGTKWAFDAPYVGNQEWDSFVGVANHR